MTTDIHHPESTNSLFTEPQAARFLNFTPRCLQAWRQRGVGPKFVRVSSRAVRYRICDLNEWINQHIKSTTTDL